MLAWLLELLARIVATPWLLQALGDVGFTWIMALSVLCGSLPWIWRGSPIAARIGHIAQRIQSPPSDVRTSAGSTAGWSRITYRSGVVVAAVGIGGESAAIYVICAALLMWGIDAAAGFSRWLHPTRREQGAALGFTDPAHFFQRAFDGALWLSLWPFIVLATFGDRLLALWIGREAPAGLIPVFAAVLPLATVAFVSGQWLQERTKANVIENIVRAEAVLVLLLTAVCWHSFGIVAPVLALLVAHLLMTTSRFTAMACRQFNAKPFVWGARRLLFAALVSAPALGVATVLSAIRPPTSTTELIVSVIVVTIAHGISSVTCWHLSARRDA